MVLLQLILEFHLNLVIHLNPVTRLNLAIHLNLDIHLNQDILLNPAIQVFNVLENTSNLFMTNFPKLRYYRSTSTLCIEGNDLSCAICIQSKLPSELIPEMCIYIDFLLIMLLVFDPSTNIYQ